MAAEQRQIAQRQNEQRPIEIERVRDEERLFGGDIVWWLLLLVVSVPAILLGLAQAPQIHGFLLLSVGAVAGGVSFAQITLRLPYLTNRFIGSFLIVFAVSAVIAGIAFFYSLTLPVPQAPPDVMYKPPISGG
jgi:hypothetical protein